MVMMIASDPPVSRIENHAPVTEDFRALVQENRATTVAKHMPLVRYVAGSMARHAGASSIVDYDDLIGYGSEGLIEAVDTFNPAFNVKFSTWAVMHIRTTIQDALRTLDPLPRSLRSKGKEIEKASYELANKNGCWPADADVAAALNVPIERLRVTMKDISKTCVSLDKIEENQNDDMGHSWIASLADDDPETSPEAVLDKSETNLLLLQAIGTLPEREQRVVEAYYRRGHSMRDIAEELGVSESRISQLHARALKLLRAHITSVLEDAPRVRTAA